MTLRSRCYTLWLVVVITLSGCAPSLPVNPQPSATVLPATSTPGPTATSRPATMTPTMTLLPSATPAQSPQVIDHLLDWQPIIGPGEALLARFAFDGRWLVTLSSGPGPKSDQPVYTLYARDIEDLPNRPRREIVTLPEGLMPAEFETGSGLDAAGGRAALLLVTAMSDDPHGYQLWLFELETGRARLVKKARALLPSFPAIALSEDWLVLKDLDAQGHECLEIYPLADDPAPTPICHAGRISGQSLSVPGHRQLGSCLHPV